jgi:flagellar basal body-associated protein FliL
MAEEKEKTKEQPKEAKDSKGNKPKQKSLMGILIMAGIVLGCSGGGFFIAKLLSPAPKAASAAEDPANPAGENPADAKASATGGHGAAPKPAAKPAAAKPAAGGHGAPAPSGGGHGGSSKPTGPVLPIVETADGWFFELDPVLANLDEPGVTRFLRAAITIQFTQEFEVSTGGPLVNEKKMILRDWLTTYFAGLSLEDVRGTMSLARIKNQIRDQFNEMLFPDSKPLVHAIILKEFAVQ